MDGSGVNFARMEEDVQIQLFQAVDINDIDSVLSCICEGVDIDSKDDNGQTPLIIASEKGHIGIVNELLSRNVDANVRDHDGWTALIAASKEGHEEIVSALLDYGAKYNIADLVGWTPLVWASYKGQCEIVQELLHYGANPNERGQHNMTALIWASGRGHTNCVQQLLRGGAKPEVADKYGTTALTWAARKGHYDVVQTLISEGANVNSSGTHGWTPLIMAAKGGYADVVSLLLQENTNVNAIDQDGRSALSWAAKEGFDEIVSKLLQKGAFVNMPDKHGDSALSHAAAEGHADVVKTLIAAYADIEMTQMEGKTPLYLAVEKGHVAVVEELLLAGADTETSINKDGETPLIRGAKRKHTHCVKLLLEKDANVQATDKKGDTALHIAVRNKFVGMFEVLLNDPRNSKLLHRANKAGETPYSIDTQNKPPVLVGLFTGNQASQGDHVQGTAKRNVLTNTLGEFLLEPPLTVPLTVGMYSRWGAGKSNYTQGLMDIFHEHQSQEVVPVFSITMAVVMLSIIVAATSGLLIWPISSSWEAGIVTAISITMFLIFAVSFTRIAVVSTSETMHGYGVLLTKHLNRIIWFFRVVYCIPPSIEELRHMLPVHLLAIDLSRSVVVGDNPMTSLVNFTRELNDAIENDIGMVIPRLYRMFQAGPYRAKSGSLQARWKTSCCCIPSFLITLVVFLALWIGIILFGVYGYKGPNAVIALEIACCCIFGAAFLAFMLRLFVMIYCLVLPMKKRVTIVSTQSGMQEETFLAVLKQELDLCVDMLECMDGFTRRQTRIIIKLDLLDSLEQQKILSLINAINLLLTEPGHPFILLLSVDPRLLIKAVDETLAAMPGPIINPRDYLKNLINLPVYIYDQPNVNYDGLIPSEIRSQLEETQSSEGDQELNNMEWGNSVTELPIAYIQQTNMRNGHTPNENGNAPLIKKEKNVKFPSTGSLNGTDNGSINEDISNLLRNNDNGTLSDVKRVMNIVSLNGRVLRNYQVTFHWTRLAVWISLCDGWPYKASWLTLLCLDTTLDLPNKTSIKSLHMILGYSMPVLAEQDIHSENSSTYFETFLSSHQPPVTVQDVRTFAQYMFYIDPTIRKLMVDYLVAMKSGSLSKQSSMQQHLSCRSNYPVSPVSSSKFMWQTAVDDQLLARMTVEDVANQLVEIEGMDESLLNTYKESIHENNINGRVLITCDLNELREAMQMKFGDWQLFKAWIVASRNKDVNRNADKTSSYRSSSRNMSYCDGSQTESIPDSPKISYTTTQKTTPRLPALNEACVGNGNIPYTSHSPRLSPQETRRTYKKTSNGKSLSQDSESSPLKHRQVDPRWHRSADSGFASTDVDPNARLVLSNFHRESSLSESEKVVENGEVRVKTDVLQINNGPSIHIESSSKSNSLEKLPASTLYNDTWNMKTEIGLKNIRKANDAFNCESSEYVAIDIEERKTWKFAKLSDSDENQSDSNINAKIEDNKDDSEKKGRPLSLSDVPLPPVSMLQSSDWPVEPPSDFADTHDDGSHSPTVAVRSPPITIQHKKAFKNKQFGSVTNYASTESERFITDNESPISVKSEPTVNVIRGSKPTIKKSRSDWTPQNTNGNTSSEQDYLLSEEEELQM